MSTNTETAIFNLKAVVNETGLKPDTLRAWERRYGIPSPQRTQSGHRLYSQREIEIVKWLSERQREGLTISRAVDMWNRLLESGEDPFANLETEQRYHEHAPGQTQNSQPCSPLRCGRAAIRDCPSSGHLARCLAWISGAWASSEG